ncbi:MAG: hypothetical protein EP305_05280 [Bacteroidetes bacterium]|nr:MAG: hypothetical protein EP305_05280 [Bacteroidota bacterium]
MRYKSRVDWFFKTAIALILVSFIAGFIQMMLDNESTSSLVLFSIVMGVVMLFLFSLIPTTYYDIKEDQLYCRSLFFKKKLPINSIRKVDVGNSLYAGMKMSLALKGIIIYFNKYDEIYISPENQDAFVQHLVKIHPQIEIIGNKKSA